MKQIGGVLGWALFIAVIIALFYSPEQIGSWFGKLSHAYSEAVK